MIHSLRAHIKIHLRSDCDLKILSDANIGKKMLDWKDPKTGETVQLGYVHEGFYDVSITFVVAFCAHM